MDEINFNQEIDKSISEISKVEQVPTLFGTRDSFEHSQRVAKMLAASELVPKQFQGNIPNCLIALEMALRIGASPLMIMQNLYVVHGKPAWSSQFLIAILNASGRFSPIRYEEIEKDGGSTRAWCYDKPSNEKLYGEWVSMKMAKDEGWIDKSGSKWKTMPGLMRRYRAATFFVRQFAPELSMGIQTYEEAKDITYTEEAVQNAKKIAQQKVDEMIGGEK